MGLGSVRVCFLLVAGHVPANADYEVIPSNSVLARQGPSGQTGRKSGNPLLWAAAYADVFTLGLMPCVPALLVAVLPHSLFPLA